MSDGRGRKTAGGAANPYAALGVSADADLEAITRAYRRLARRFHPDVRPADPDASAKFRALTAAYERVFDTTRHQAGNRDLGTGGPAKDEACPPPGATRTQEESPVFVRTVESRFAQPLWAGPVRVEAPASLTRQRRRATTESPVRLVMWARSGVRSGRWIV